MPRLLWLHILRYYTTLRLFLFHCCLSRGESTASCTLPGGVYRVSAVRAGGFVEPESQELWCNCLHEHLYIIAPYSISVTHNAALLTSENQPTTLRRTFTVTGTYPYFTYKWLSLCACVCALHRRVFGTGRGKCGFFESMGTLIFESKMSALRTLPLVICQVNAWRCSECCYINVFT